MWCPARGCGFESRALRFSKQLHRSGFCAQAQNASRVVASVLALRRWIAVQCDAERCHQNGATMNTRFPTPKLTALSRVTIAATILIGVLSAASTIVAIEPVSPGVGFRFQPVSDRSLGLWEGDRAVLVYNHGLIARPEVAGARARACYFHPVYGLD